MRPPSTEWRETIASDEAERFERYAQGFAAAQRRRNERQGVGRALHRRQVAALRGEIEILGDLPDHARQGVFATAGRRDVIVRLSNGAPDRNPDRRPDVRGFSFKILGVDGPNALGTGRTNEQDFSLINHMKFSTARAADFCEMVLAFERGPLALLGYLVRRYGVVGAIRQAKAASALVTKPFSGFATEVFSTALPFRNGRWAARLRLVPPLDRAREGAREDWLADLRAHLDNGPLVYRVQLQFFVDERITPIEDASVDWPETEAPYLDVARLTIPNQSFDDEAAKTLEHRCETGIFDPWNALAEHRPLGDVMRARKTAYYASQKARGAAS